MAWCFAAETAAEWVWTNRRCSTMEWNSGIISINFSVGFAEARLCPVM